MRELKFDVSDFQMGLAGNFDDIYAELASRAQAKFDSWLRSLPVVYSEYDFVSLDYGTWDYQDQRPHHMYQARLAYVERIPVVDCKHNGLIRTVGDGPVDFQRDVFRCEQCGARLKPHWEVMYDEED